MSHRRILLLFLVFFTILAGTTYLFLFRTGAATTFVEELIGKSIRRQLFQLDEAEIDLAGGKVTIREFELAHPEDTDSKRKLLSINRVEVDLETNPLDEIGAVRGLVLDGLTIDLDLTNGTGPDFGAIFKEAGVEEETDGKLDLRTISITNSKVHLRIAADRAPVTFEQLNLTLQRTDEDTKSVQLRGSLRSPLGHEVILSGGGDLGTMDFRSVLTIRDLPIRAEHAAMFKPEASKVIDAAKASGRISKAQLWLEYRGSAPSDAARFRGGVSAELEELGLQPASFPYPIEGARGKIFAEFAEESTVRFEVEKLGIDGNIKARGEIEDLAGTPRFATDVKLEGLLISPRLFDAVARGKLQSLRDIKTAFAPTQGRFDAKIQVFSTKDGDIDAAANIDLRGVAGRFQGFIESDGDQIGFPYPMQDVSGRIRLRSGIVYVDEVKGKDRDGAPFTVTGEVSEIYTSEPRINLDIDCENIKFSPDVRSALAKTFAEGPSVYDEFAPRGQTDISVRLRDDGTGLTYAVILEPRQASAEYALFPYRLQNLGGSITVTDEGAFLDLTGSRDGASASINGRFLFDDQKTVQGLRSELQVKVENSTFHADLFRAVNHLNREIGTFWQELQPKGKHDVTVTLWRNFGAKDFSYDVHLGVRESSIVLKRLPLPITGVHGDLFVHGSGDTIRCDVSPLRGEIDNGEGHPKALVLVQGSIFGLGKKPTAEVTSIVQRLRLTKDVGAALAAGGVLEQSIWDNLALDGFTDVTAHHQLDPKTLDLVGSYRLRLRDVTSAAAALPGKLAEDVHGEIVFENDIATFESIIGRIDGTTVSVLKGRSYRKAGDRVLEFEASADSYPIDDRLAKSMDATAREAFLRLRMRGSVRLKHVHVTFRFPEDGKPWRSEFRGDVEAQGLFMDVGLPGGQVLEHLNGTISITQGSDRGLVGRLVNGRFDLTKQQIEDIACDFALDAQSLVLKNLSFGLAGGRIRGGTPTDPRSLVFEFSERGRIFASLSYDNILLGQLLRSTALARSKVSGTCKGRIVIENLEGLDLLTLRAHGGLEIRNGRLGTVPLFAAIYTHIREDKRPQFTRGKVSFKVADQKIRFEDLSAHSSLVRIQGGGTLDMDGYMDIDLGVPGVFDPVADILIVPRMLDEVVSQIARFKVFGYLRNPRIEPALPFKTFARQSLAPIPPLRVVSKPDRAPDARR